MRLLVNTEIEVALENPDTTAIAYIPGTQPQSVEEKHIGYSSLNLTIGEIFLPGSKKDELGGSNNPKTLHTLGQGHTAVIRTREKLRMGSLRSAIAFPPSHESLRGLLMTNPGHIDPGYEGPLHCTVINMGHEGYPLVRGDEIMRVLFFQLDQAKQAAPSGGIGPLKSPINTELLARLSVDFVDVDERAKKIASKAVGKASLIAAGLGILIPAVLGFAGATYVYPLKSISDGVDILKRETVTKIEEQKDYLSLKGKVDTLDAQFTKDERLESRLKALEDKLNIHPTSTQPNPSRQ
jgi:dUTPase